MKRTGTEDRIVGPHQYFKQIDAYVPANNYSSANNCSNHPTSRSAFIMVTYSLKFGI